MKGIKMIGIYSVVVLWIQEGTPKCEVFQNGKLASEFIDNLQSMNSVTMIKMIREQVMFRDTITQEWSESV